ncbi:phage tail tape measure protein, partial [Microbacterium arborescens]
ERVEKNPLKVDADAKGAIASADRVEAAFAASFAGAAGASKSTSQQLVRDFLESERAGKMSAEKIQSVLTNSYGVAEDKAKALADAVTNPMRMQIREEGAVAAAERVEKAAKKAVSEAAAGRLDLDITRAEKSVQRVQERIEGLQVRALGGLDVTADIRRAEAQLSKLERNLNGLTSAREQIEVLAVVEPAIKDIQRVEKATTRVVSQDTALRINAEVKAAENAIADIERELDYLRALRPTVQVEADVAAAEAKLDTARAILKDLDGSRAEMLVDVNEGGAKQKLEQVADFARDAGERGGKSLTGGLDAATRGAGEKVGQVVGGDIEETLVSALAAIPVAGGIVLAGVAIGKAITGAIQDGLAVEKRTDRLEALTGIDEESAARLGRAAGEAYANVFGESIDANMSTARIATQFRLIDPDATTRDAQQVIEGLSGIADVLDEDVFPTSRAVATMLRTGLAKSAGEAFDVLAAGARNGVNLGEDLLDTFNEYGSVFASLGISGPEALGLLNQGLIAGARNSDVVADGLLELRNLTTDLSDDTRSAFDRMGLSADDMAAKIAAGGPSAREALGQIFDGLRSIEDPLARNAAGIDIFGTKWEDTAGALGALDLSSAVGQLDGVAGSAQRMFDTLASNDATKVEQAQRNIEVAADGIKGALAVAFSEPLGDLSEWVSSNRGPLLQFFSDLINGAFDFGIAANTAIGDFVSGPLEQMVEGLKNARRIIAPFADTTEIDELQDAMREFGDSTDAANDKLEEMRDGTNRFLDPMIAEAFLTDRMRDFANAIDDVTAAQDGSAEAASALRDQARAAVDALVAQQDAAAAAGDEAGELAQRWKDGAGALATQLQAMGLTEVQAWELIAAYAGIPESEITEITSNAPDEQSKVQALVDRVNSIPNGRTHISANTGAALGSIGAVVTELSKVKDKTVTVSAISKVGNFVGQLQSIYGKPMARGGVLEFMAQGGVRGGGLKPMESLAQMVPPSTWRV